MANARTRIPQRRRRWSPVILCVALGIGSSTFLAACSPYRLRGLVMEGPVSTVMVVDANDPRLQQPGLPEAVIEVTLRPHDIRPKAFPPQVADGEGRFDFGIDEPGLGFLEYDLLVAARKEGYKSAWQVMQAPGAGRRLLFMVAPGRDDYRPYNDILRDTMKMGERWMGP